MSLVNIIVSNSRLLAAFLFLISAVPLGMALISQYFFGLAPCILCIYQRIPFGVGMFIATAYFLVPYIRNRTSLVLITTSLVMFVNTAIAIFHTGVEYGWWKGTGSCGGNLSADSIEALRAQIMNAPTASCSDPAFVFMGLSMAGWNVVYCGVIGFMLLFILSEWRNAHAKS